jgi:hypothetical protein
LEDNCQKVPLRKKFLEYKGWPITKEMRKIEMTRVRRMNKKQARVYGGRRQ